MYSCFLSNLLHYPSTRSCVPWNEAVALWVQRIVAIGKMSLYVVPLRGMKNQERYHKVSAKPASGGSLPHD